MARKFNEVFDRSKIPQEFEFTPETIKRFCSENHIPMLFKECPEWNGFQIAILKQHLSIINKFLHETKPVKIMSEVITVDKIEELTNDLFLEDK